MYVRRVCVEPNHIDRPFNPYLLKEGHIDGSCMTVTGKTLAENLASCPDLSPGQEVIMPLDNPIKKTGHLQCLYGNIAPEGSVAKAGTTHTHTSTRFVSFRSTSTY